MRVGIIGCGLMGGSILKAANAAGHDVIGWDPDPATNDALAADGFDVVAPQDLTDVDVVVLAGPPDSTGPWAARLLSRSETLVVTDVSSYKTQLAQYLADHVTSEQRARFVSGHPLAARSGHGYLLSDERMFQDAPWSVCYTQAAPVTLHALSMVDRLARACGAAITPMSPAEHDRQLAYNAHLTQVVSTVLIETLAGQDHGPNWMLTGGGLRDMTSTADANGATWAQVLCGNRQQTAAAIRRFQEHLQDLYADVVGGDVSRLAARVDQAARDHGDLHAVRWSAQRSWQRHEFTGSAARLLLPAHGKLVRNVHVGDGGFSAEISG